VSPQDYSEHTFGSTTYRWKKVIVSQRPAPQEAQREARKGLRRLPRRDPRQPLTMTIKYRGGSEGWVEIHARGEILRVPGYRAIIDLLFMLNNQ
jgi:hypothetical protein